VIAESLLRGWVAMYAAAAVIAVARAMARRASERDESATEGASARASDDESVVLVRAVAGEEVGLARRLAQTGGAGLVIFAVGSRTDPAEPIAQRVAARLRSRGVDATVFVTNAVGPNHKADQLARTLALPRARARQIVVVADGDVELGHDGVERLVGALGESDAVWAPPVERGGTRTWGDRASHAVLDASLHSFPLLAGIDPYGLVGKLFGVRRSALEAAGGFDALTRHLGEDMELARRLRLLGRVVTVAPQLAIATAEGRSLRDVVARYARWLLVVRAQRPLLLVSYPLLLAASPVLLAIVAVAIARHDGALATVAVSGLAVRFGIACFARATAGLSIAPLAAAVQMLTGDVVLLIALAMACTARDLTWRGRRLVIAPDGTLENAPTRGRSGRSAGSGREHAGEQPLREAPEDARPLSHHLLEFVENHEVFRIGQRSVDPRELALDALPLGVDATSDVALGGQRGPDRDPHVRALGGAEHVTKTHRQDDGALRDAGDLRGAGAEVQGGERGALAALREDPHGAPLGREEARRVTDGACAVGGLVHVDTERPDAPEEGYASEVRRIHHRVAVAPEQQLRDVERDERVPPRRVIGDEEERMLSRGEARLGEAGDEHPAERAADARARVPREPGVEPAALRGLDHEVTS
jgi:ceramide glucosyltransferase